jgi:hypothetical protein
LDLDDDDGPVVQPLHQAVIDGFIEEKRRGPPIESELSDRQRALLFQLLVALAGNPAHAKDDPLTLTKRARDLVINATAIKAQDKE